MGISADNYLSERFWGIDNDLAPFHKSVSCWAIFIIWLCNIGVAAKHYSSWLANNMTLWFWSALGLSISVMAILFISRIRQAKLLDAYRAESNLITTEEIPTQTFLLKSLKHQSALVTRLTAVLLFVLMGVLSHV